ncbi:MAG: putative ester cyclase [Verrucomicrobiales bacterium]|jgi:predicted ester cyclase
MAHSNPVTVARSFREALWSNGDAPAVEDIIAPNCVIHGRAPLSTGFVSGPMPIRHLVDFYKLTFSDISVTIDHTVSENDMVTVHWRARARHTGDLMGVQPTGREVETSGIDLVRIENDRIAEAWIYWDEISLLSQLVDDKVPSSEGAGPDLLQVVERMLA